MRTLCIAGVTMLGLIVYCFVSLFGTARLLSIADITRASGTPPSLLLLPKRRKQRRRKRTKGGALEWRQSTQPHESISLPQRKGRNASSCDCATPCRWRNTGAESPLDPLKFCYVFSSDCLFSTNGAHIVPGESAMSASSAAASIAWIHCDEHTHFDWFGTAEETTREWARQMKWRKRREGGAQGAPSRVPRSIRTSAGTLANRDVESAAAVSGARAILVNRKVWGVAAVARLSPESVRNALLDYLSRTQRIAWSALERRSTAELVAWVASWDVEEGGRRRHDTTRRIGIDPSHPSMKGNKVEAGALAAAREEIFNRKLGGLHSGATLSPTAVRKVLITWLHSEALGYPLAELDRRSTAQLISWIQSWHHHDPHTLFHRRPLRGSVSPIDGSSLNHNANSLFATNHHHQPQSNHHHDYIYHVDCPGGAMGVNAGLWWWLIALAHRTNLRLVWNPSLFVSPNHPQYKSNPLFECHDDAKVIGGGRGCASPSDLWTGMGLWRAGSPVANGMTSRRLFQLIESGDMEAVLIDRREVYIDEKKYFDGFVQTIEMRKANWDQKKKAKPKVVIIKRCGWTHTREAINFVPGLQIWAHRTYQSARLALRSSLPEPLYSLKPLTFAIVVALRRGAGAIGIDRVEYISRVILAMFDSGVGLSCETAHTIVVSQPHETHLKELAHFDDALGKDCWTLHSSSYLDTSAAQSARDVFKDMDVLSNADVFIPSLMSKFSQLAGGTLAHPRSVKMVATGPGDCLRYFDAKSDLTWGPNVVQVAENSGCFDARMFAAAWTGRALDASTIAHCAEFCARSKRDEEKLHILRKNHAYLLAKRRPALTALEQLSKMDVIRERELGTPPDPLMGAYWKLFWNNRSTTCDFPQAMEDTKCAGLTHISEEEIATALTLNMRANTSSDDLDRVVLSEVESLMSCQRACCARGETCVVWQWKNSECWLGSDTCERREVPQNWGWLGAMRAGFNSSTVTASDTGRPWWEE